MDGTNQVDKASAFIDHLLECVYPDAVTLTLCWVDPPDYRLIIDDPNYLMFSLAL